MKTIKYENTEYQVPDWANYLSSNNGNNIIVWEKEPELEDSYGGSSTYVGYGKRETIYFNHQRASLIKI